jgi:hypothetical protein
MRCALLSLLSVFVISAGPAVARDRQPFHVKYVASADAGRTADFKKFLEAEFATVSVANGLDFDPKKSDSYDVLIIDSRIHKGLPPDFAQPILLLGSNAQGANSISENGLWTAHMAGSKFDWLCLCLGNKAYNVDTKHAIFRTPYTVTTTFHRETNPYTKRPIDAWTVHKELANAWGLVSSAEHFRGAADSEIISGGINMKGDRGVCLVREGHTFFWGFAGTPSQMTDEARKVFVNAVVYIKQFEGQKQTVRRGVFPRAHLGELRGKFFESKFNVARYFTPDVVAKFGTDGEKYTAVFKADVDYAYVPAWHWGIMVDEEAKQLGIPNYDVRMLDRCVVMLEANENSNLAKTLLTRYTGEAFATPQAWRNWLSKSRDRLYFLDSHGYRFFTQADNAPPAKWQLNEALAALKVAKPTVVEPVITGATIVSRYARSGSGAFTAAMASAGDVAMAYPGDVMTLLVRMRVAEPWHTYAKVTAGSAMKPTTIDIKLPSGMRFAGDWSFPLEKPSETPDTTVYEGDLLFTRDVLVTAKSGAMTVTGTVQYQACDPERCQPPRSEPINLKVQVSDR